MADISSGQLRATVSLLTSIRGSDIEIQILHQLILLCRNLDDHFQLDLDEVKVVSMRKCICSVL